MRKLLTVVAILFSTYTLSAQNRHVGILAPNKEEFLKKNTEIDSIQRKSSDLITLFLKSGVTENYNLGIVTDRQKFIAHYGTPPHYVTDKNDRLSRRKKQ